MSTPTPPSLKEIDPAAAWQPWQPDAIQPWDLKWAGHLYRRATFGASGAEYFVELVGHRHVQLVVRARLGGAVGTPADELRGVPEPVPGWKTAGC